MIEVPDGQYAYMEIGDLVAMGNERRDLQAKVGELARDLAALRTELFIERQKSAKLLMALKMAEPYVYNSPFEGSLDTWLVITSMIESLEGAIEWTAA